MSPSPHSSSSPPTRESAPQMTPLSAGSSTPTGVVPPGALSVGGLPTGAMSNGGVAAFAYNPFATFTAVQQAAAAQAAAGHFLGRGQYDETTTKCLLNHEQTK